MGLRLCRAGAPPCVRVDVCAGRARPPTPAGPRRPLSSWSTCSSPSGRCSPAPSGGSGENRPWVGPGREGAGPAPAPRGGGGGEGKMGQGGGEDGGGGGGTRAAWWGEQRGRCDGRDGGGTGGHGGRFPEGEGGRQVSGTAGSREGNSGGLGGRRASGSPARSRLAGLTWGRERVSSEQLPHASPPKYGE